MDTCKTLNTSKCSMKNFLKTFFVIGKRTSITHCGSFREPDLRRYLGIFWRLSSFPPLSGTTEFSGGEGTCSRSPASQRQSFRHQASDFNEVLQTVDSRESKGNPLSSLLRIHRSKLFFSLHKPFPVFSSLILKMCLTLAIYCLTTSNFFDSWT